MHSNRTRRLRALPGNCLFLRGCDVAWEALLAARDVGQRMHALCALHSSKVREAERLRAGRQVTDIGQGVLSTQLGVYRALDTLPLPVEDFLAAFEAHVDKSRAYFATGWLNLLGSVVGEIFESSESPMEHLSSFVVIETALSTVMQ